ncbi:type II toxin-antitoxin system VapC family toxin [Phyllobacterium sp. LjRoot231]|uniref:type II toxin-antitoxin system VapC family toxin n=1 Tax=Phyllobacterium sp. LjRoot231 TaxID=3342289 RepID=UPI003ECCAA2F
MFVDASVIVAILLKESAAQAFSQQLVDAQSRILITSVIAVWEATAVIFKEKRLSMAESELEIKAFLDAANIKVLPVSNEDLPTALQAFERYGRHHYSANNRNSALNLADCFHYATAKSHRAPILTKDAGFALTDLKTVSTTKDQ